MNSIGPTVIAIMLGSGGISQSNSIIKASKVFRETKLFNTQSPTVIAIMLGSRDLAYWQAK